MYMYMYMYNYIIICLFKLSLSTYIKVNYTTCNSSIYIVCSSNLPYNSIIEWKFNNKVILNNNNTLKFNFNNNLSGNYTCKALNLFNKIELQLVTNWVTSEEKTVILYLLVTKLVVLWITILTLSLKINKFKKVINLYATLIWVTILCLFIQYILRLNKKYSFIDIYGIMLISVLLFSSIGVNVLTLLKIKKNKYLIVIIILKTVASILFFLVYLLILFYCYKNVFGLFLIYNLLIINIFELSYLVCLLIIPIELRIKYKKLIMIKSNLNL
ncbi:CD47-like protein [Tanapox virus]|uniref:CD47-like protein n=2 Tax=Tanapox virus TaxID=99000 RepID=A7XCR4_9POXV|nr:CD47-like protein [Tanapox virus]